MGGEKAKGQLTKNGEQDRPRPATDKRLLGPHGAEEHEKVQQSSPGTLKSAEELASEPGDLPRSYGETRVVLLPVEPYLVHVYWEVASVDLEKAKCQLGDKYEQSQPVLRFYDISNIIFDGTNAHSYFDVGIDLTANNSYVDVWSPDKSYLVELGLKTEEEPFFSFAKSNIVETPPAWLAPEADEHYMLIKGDYDLCEVVPAPMERLPEHNLPAQAAAPDRTDEHLHGMERLPQYDLPPETKVLDQTHEHRCGMGCIEGGETNASVETRLTKAAPESLNSMEQSSKEKERPVQYEGGSEQGLAEMSDKRFSFGVSSK